MNPILSYRTVTEAQLLEILSASGKPNFNGIDLTSHTDFIKKFYLEKLKSLPKPRKTYKYFVTFTTKSKDVESQAEEYVKSRASLPWVEHLDFCSEYSDAGMYHFHCLFETNIPIQAAKQFGYYKKLYGFVKMDRVKPQTEQSILSYMSKDSTVIHLI